jgi:hypothetical protein
MITFKEKCEIAYRPRYEYIYVYFLTLLILTQDRGET